MLCRDVFLEKHWKSAVARSLCDYFFDQQQKVLFSEDTPPIIATPHHYLISIYRCALFFVAVCSTEGIKFSSILLLLNRKLIASNLTIDIIGTYYIYVDIRFMPIT